MSYTPITPGTKIGFSAYNSALQSNNSSSTIIEMDTHDNVTVTSNTNVNLPSHSFAWADVRQYYYGTPTGNANLTWNSSSLERTKGTEQTGDTRSGTKDMGPAVAYALNLTASTVISTVTNTNTNPTISFRELANYNRIIGLKIK